MNELFDNPSKNGKEDAFKKLFLDLIDGTETDWFRELLDSLNEAIIIAQDGHLRYFNRTLIDILDLTPQELFKTSFLDLIHPDDRMMIFDRHKRRSAGEELPDQYTFRILDRSGKTQWIEIKVISIKWRGKPAMLCLLSEITGEGGGRDTYRKILDNAFDAIYLIDDNGYLYVNPSFERMTGYSAEELTSDQFDYNTLLTERSRELIASRYRTRKEGKEISPRYRTQVRRSDSSIIEVDVTTVPMAEEGRILVMGIMRDITKVVRVEEALKREKEYYLSFLESLGDWAWEIDLEGTYIFSNPVVMDILGYQKDEVIGRAVWDLWPGEYRSEDTVDQFKRKLLSGNSWRNMRGSIRRKDGTIMVTESTGVPLHDSKGNLVGYRGLDRDITKRYIDEEHMKTDMADLERQVDIRTKELWELNRDLEEQIKEKEKLQAEMLRAAKLDSLGVLAGGIAHDFNNLLTGIMGNLSLASARPNDPEWMKERISDAEAAARRAKGLTRQLLSFSKGGNPILKPTSLEELVEETCKFALVGSNVKADIDVEGNLWNVEADQGQINQVIHNLVLNASQAMPEGGYIWIRARNVDLMKEDGVPLLPGRYVRIDVEDEGCGIPRDQLERIFDPYFTTKETGNGLGLASCYSIIKHHNGHISARSREGEGTRFIIYLPATEKKANEMIDMKEGSGSFKGSILVMDNDEIVLNVMRNMLNTLGFEVFTTRDGFGAISLYSRSVEEGEPFSAALLEMSIPGGSGGEDLARRIMEIHPKARIIALTAGESSRVEDPNRFKDVLTKPLRLADLKLSLSRMMNEKVAEESKKEG